MVGREKQGLIPHRITVGQLREPLLSSKLCWCLLPGKAPLPCLGEPGWMCPVGCVISKEPLLPLLAEHSEDRDEQNARVCAWCRDDPLGSATKYFIWTKFRAQPDWLQSPWTQPAWMRWQTQLSLVLLSSCFPAQLSSRTVLATSAHWEREICKQGRAC